MLAVLSGGASGGPSGGSRAKRGLQRSLFDHAPRNQEMMKLSERSPRLTWWPTCLARRAIAQLCLPSSPRSPLVYRNDGSCGCRTPLSGLSRAARHGTVGHQICWKELVPLRISPLAQFAQNSGISGILLVIYSQCGYRIKESE